MKDIFNEEQIKKMQEIIDDYLFTKKICITLLDDELDAPKYAHETDAAFDLQSREKLVIKPGEKAMIATGIKIRIPAGYEIQIRPRSGISFLASTSLFASTSPKPSSADSGGLIPSSSTKNFTESDLYRSTGKKSIPLSFISRTISNIGYIFFSLFEAAFPRVVISFILAFTFSSPWIMLSPSKSSALIEKNEA